MRSSWSTRIWEKSRARAPAAPGLPAPRRDGAAGPAGRSSAWNVCDSRATTGLVSCWCSLVDASSLMPKASAILDKLEQHLLGLKERWSGARARLDSSRRTRVASRKTAWRTGASACHGLHLAGHDGQVEKDPDQRVQQRSLMVSRSSPKMGVPSRSCCGAAGGHGLAGDEPDGSVAAQPRSRLPV